MGSQVAETQCVVQRPAGRRIGFCVHPKTLLCQLFHCAQERSAIPAPQPSKHKALHIYTYLIYIYIYIISLHCRRFCFTSLLLLHWCFTSSSQELRLACFTSLLALRPACAQHARNKTQAAQHARQQAQHKHAAHTQNIHNTYNMHNTHT